MLALVVRQSNTNLSCAGAQFSFKSFAKEKGSDDADASIHKLGLVYIRTNTGTLLHQEVPEPQFMIQIGRSQHKVLDTPVLI